jgi:hypothetical protein
MAWPESQGSPPSTWNDCRQGCLGTFRGGHDEPGESAAFCDGMETVFNLTAAPAGGEMGRGTWPSHLVKP